MHNPVAAEDRAEHLSRQGRGDGEVARTAQQTGTFRLAAVHRLHDQANLVRHDPLSRLLEAAHCLPGTPG